MSKRAWCALCGAVAVVLVSFSNVRAQGYPERPINFIVPWPAGGGTDIAMRALAEVLAKQMNARFVIDNYYLSTEDYAQRVKVWYEEEKANVARVGLSLKP